MLLVLLSISTTLLLAAQALGLALLVLCALALVPTLFALMILATRP